MKWKELTPGFYRRPAEELFFRFPLLPALNVLQKCHGKVNIILRSIVIIGIQNHLRTADVELGGLLIGRVYEHITDPTGTVVFVEASVDAEDFRATGASLHMSSSVWEKARVRERRRTDRNWLVSQPP